MWEIEKIERYAMKNSKKCQKSSSDSNKNKREWEIFVEFPSNIPEPKIFCLHSLIEGL